jgi:quinol monooxygenase YgiN
VHKSPFMVRLTVTLSASSQRHVQDLLEALRFLMSGTRLQPGCRECSVWVDPESTVHYIEEFETETDMRQRVRSSKFTSLLGVIESAHQPRCVRFDFVTSTSGLEYVSQVRNNAPN